MSISPSARTNVTGPRSPVTTSAPPNVTPPSASTTTSRPSSPSISVPMSALNNTLAVLASIVRSLASPNRLSIVAFDVNRMSPPAPPVPPSVTIVTLVCSSTAPLNRTSAFSVVTLPLR